jgi:hypothetical protein
MDSPEKVWCEASRREGDGEIEEALWAKAGNIPKVIGDFLTTPIESVEISMLELNAAWKNLQESFFLTIERGDSGRHFVSQGEQRPIEKLTQRIVHFVCHQLPSLRRGILTRPFSPGNPSSGPAKVTKASGSPGDLKTQTSCHCKQP